MLGESAVGRVEDEIHFVDAAGTGRDGFGGEAFEIAAEEFGVADGEFDFGFAGHGGSLRVGGGKGKWRVASGERRDKREAGRVTGGGSSDSIAVT